MPSIFWDAHEGLRAVVLIICSIGALSCVLYVCLLYISWHRRELVALSILGIVVLGVFGVCKAPTLFVSHFLPTPLTLRNLFDTDFMSRPGLNLDVDGQFTFWLPSGNTVTIPYRTINDFDTHSRALAFYITPMAKEPEYEMCATVVEQYRNVLDFIKKVGTSNKESGDSLRDESNDLIFANRIYLYLETDLDLKQMAALQQLYEERNISLQMRGHDYLFAHWNEKREPPARVPLPFISRP